MCVCVLVCSISKCGCAPRHEHTSASVHFNMAENKLIRYKTNAHIILYYIKISIVLVLINHRQHHCSIASPG